MILVDENKQVLTFVGMLCVHERTVGAVDVYIQSENFEVVDNEHLVEEGERAGEEFRIGKLSLGASARLGTAGPLAFDAGGLVSVYHVPSRLEPDYGETPVSGIVFLRTSLE